MSEVAGNIIAIILTILTVWVGCIAYWAERIAKALETRPCEKERTRL